MTAADLNALAVFGGTLTGYGALMTWISVAIADLEHEALLRRIGVYYLPLTGLICFVGLTASVTGILCLATAIWP